MDTAYCAECGVARLDANEVIDGQRRPCSACGSRAVQFRHHLRGSIEINSSVSGLRTRDGEHDLYMEGANSGGVRGREVLPDGSVAGQYAGRTSKNEEDTEQVGMLLRSKLSAAHTVELLSREEQRTRPAISDVALCIDGVIVDVQVRRVLPYPAFYRDVAREGEASLVGPPEEWAQGIYDAIAAKSQLYAAEAKQLVILALDATRVPAVALPRVTTIFRERHSTWAQQHGFKAIYLVGPVVELVELLS